jgi:hypothetical protein
MPVNNISLYFCYFVIYIMNNRDTYPMRKALLIGSPGGNETAFLKGVSHDLRNFSNFLKSEKGGVWYDHEIETLHNPSYDSVLKAVRNCTADYVIIYFSGHGFTDIKTGGRMVCLKDMYISDTHFLNESPRQLVLVDACRNYSQPGISGIPEKQEEPSHFEGSPVRNLFDRYIKNSPAGKVIIHSTKAGLSSFDTPNGGKFTTALLRFEPKLLSGQQYTPVPIDRVINFITLYFKANGNEEVPTITYKKGNLSVPFTIGVSKDEQIGSVEYVKEDSSEGLVLLGIGLLILGIAAASSK